MVRTERAVARAVAGLVETLKGVLVVRRNVEGLGDLVVRVDDGNDKVNVPVLERFPEEADPVRINQKAMGADLQGVCRRRAADKANEGLSRANQGRLDGQGAQCMSNAICDSFVSSQLIVLL